MRGFGNVPLIVVVIVLSMVLGFSMFTRGHEWGDDWASYVMQAQSILDGKTDEFVERNAFTIFESSVQIGPVAYPWGYPLMLAPALMLRGVHALTLKLPGLFFFAGFLVCLYLLTKDRFTRTESLLFVSLFAFNPMLVGYLDYILSDIPFLFFSTLALMMMTRQRDGGARSQGLLGGAIFLAFSVRTTGILLLAGFLVAEFLNVLKNRMNRETVLLNLRRPLIVCGVFGLLWVVYLLLFPGGEESYFAQYQSFQVKTAIGFVGAYFRLFHHFFGASIFWRNLYYVLFTFFLIGLWVRRRDDTVFIVVYVLWMLLLITWPFWQGERFIFPLLPIFIYFTFWGMKTVAAKIPQKLQQAGQWMSNAFWLVIIGMFFFQSVNMAYVNLRDDRSIGGPFDPFSRDMYDFVKQETPPDSVIIFFKPRAFHLFTERNSIMALECERLQIADYVVTHKTWEYSQIPPDEVDECPTPVTPLFENARYIVYEIQK
jgi:hypothetical protein